MVLQIKIILQLWRFFIEDKFSFMILILGRNAYNSACNNMIGISDIVKPRDSGKKPWVTIKRFGDVP
jgi:hypothetical protein